MQIETVVLDKRLRKQATWKDLKDVNLQDEDQILSQYEEPYFSENNSYDGGWMLRVTRMRPETTEEIEKRTEKERLLRISTRQNKKDLIAKWLKEFEDEGQQ